MQDYDELLSRRIALTSDLEDAKNKVFILRNELARINDLLKPHLTALNMEARLRSYQNMTLRLLQMKHASTGSRPEKDAYADLAEARRIAARAIVTYGGVVPSDYEVVDSMEGARLIAERKLPSLTKKNYRYR